MKTFYADIFDARIPLPPSLPEVPPVTRGRRQACALDTARAKTGFDALMCFSAL